MAVHAVVRRVDLATDEPFPERRVAGIEDRVIWLEPGQHIRIFSEAVRKLVEPELFKDMRVSHVRLCLEFLGRRIGLLFLPMHSNLRFADLGELFRFDCLCHVIEGWGVPFQVRYAARWRRGQGAGGARGSALQYAPHRSLCDDAARSPAPPPFYKRFPAPRVAGWARGRRGGAPAPLGP